MMTYMTKDQIKNFFENFPHIVLLLDKDDKILYKNYIARTIGGTLRVGAHFSIYSDIKLFSGKLVTGYMLGERYTFYSVEMEKTCDKLVFASFDIFDQTGYCDVSQFYAMLIKNLPPCFEENSNTLDNEADTDIFHTKMHTRLIFSNIEKLRIYTKFVESFKKNQSFPVYKASYDLRCVFEQLCEKFNVRCPVPDLKVELCCADETVFCKVHLSTFLLAVFNTIKFYVINSRTDRIKITVARKKDVAKIVFSFEERHDILSVYGEENFKFGKEANTFLFPCLWITNEMCRKNDIKITVGNEKKEKTNYINFTYELPIDNSDPSIIFLKETDKAINEYIDEAFDLFSYEILDIIR